MLKTSDNQYKYQQLKDYLIAKISSGQYSSNFQLASESQLCEQFNLSRNTTRQALQELEQAGYIYRIRGKGTFVRENIPQKSKKIAFLIFDTNYMTYPVTANLIKGIDEVLCKNGYALDILASKRSLTTEQIDKLKSTYAGFLIGAYQIEEAILSELLNSSCPYFFVKNYLDAYKDKAILIDFEKAGFLSAQHLITCGCQNLGLVYAGEEINISRDFANGVRKAALEYGCMLKQINQKICSFNSTLDSSTIANEFITQKVDGIACFGDEFALSLLEEFKQKQLYIPQDIKVVGCNNILLAKFSQPSLTTLELPTYELGQLAANHLLNVINGQPLDKKIVLEPELIIRKSTNNKQ